MTVRTATVRAVNCIRGDDNVIGSENAAFKTRIYHISIDSNAVTVIGGTDTLACDVAAAINGANREGKTVTVLSVAYCSVVQNLYDATNDHSYAATLTLSGTTVSLSPVTSDGTTNATIATGAVAGRPYTICVAVNEA